MILGYTAQSQVLIALLLGDKLNSGKVEFGLDGGWNYAQIGGMESNKWNRNWNLGFYFDIKMKDQWYLNTGVLVKSTLGIADLTENDLDFLDATTYDPEGEYSQKLSYFLVPALARYKFDNHIYAEIGPQFGVRTRAHIEYTSDIDGNEARIREDNKDQTNWFDMGLSIGTGYRLLKGLGWTIGARYYYGFLDVYKDKSGSNNSSLFLKLNVPFGLSMEKKQEIKDFKAKNKERKAQKKAEKKARKATEKETVIEN